MVLKERTAPTAANALGSISSMTARGGSIEDQRLHDYVEMREKALFDVVNAIYKEAAAKLHANVQQELVMPKVIAASKDDGRGAVAAYNGSAIIVYERAFWIYEKMEEARRRGDHTKAQQSAYQLDQIIGHELGHALLHTAYFNYDPNYSYAIGACRRKDDGLAEVIGYYAAQKVNGMPVDNDSIADALDRKLRSDIQQVRDLRGETLADWSYLPDVEKEEKSKKVNGYCEVLVYYDYPLVGFLQALRANSEMDLPTLISDTLQYPQKLDSVMRHAVEVFGSAARLTSAVDMANALTKARDAIDLRGMACMRVGRQLELMGDLCNEMSGSLV